MLLRLSVVAAVGQALAWANGARAQLATMRRIFETCQADREAFADQAVSARLLDDAQRLRRRTKGFVAELRLFAEVWRPPAIYQGPRWRVAFSAETASVAEGAAWTDLADGPPVWIAGAGILVQFTHAEVIADLLIP
jgi:hypothetical protein